MSGKRRNADCLFLIVIGFLLAILFRAAAASPLNETGVFHGLNYNLAVYVGALGAAFIIFMIYLLLMKRFERSLLYSDLPDPEAPSGNAFVRRVLYAVYIATAATVLILIYQIYVHENSLYPENTAATYLRQEVPHAVYFGVITALTLVIFFSLRSSEPYAPNRVLRLGLIPVCAFFSASLVYCPNILKDTGAGTLHIHAVTNTIVNVMHGAPYSDISCSIYGHYALFLAPLARLFGGGLNGIMLSLSAAAFIAFAAAFYAAHKLVRHNAVYVLTVFGITGTTTILTRRGQYFQVNPLRLLFPALTLALIAFSISHTETKHRKTVIVMEFLLSAVSLVWNFETGLFCTLVIMVMRVYRALYTDPLFSRHTLGTIVTAIGSAAASLLTAICIVGFYNLASGGEFGTIRQFIYPLFSGTYNVNHLRYRLPSVTYLYFFEILLFLFTIFILLRGQAARKSGDRVSETVAAAASLSGLLSLIYFMNRAVYGNMSISHIQLNLVIGYWAARAMRIRPGTLKEKLSSPSRFLSTSLLCITLLAAVFLSVEGAMYLEVASDFRVRSSWKTASLDEAVAAVQEAVPKDTYAFGTYVPEIYAALGWNTGCYMTDWSDINELNRNYAFDGAAAQNAVLTSVEDFSDPAFELAAEIPVGEYTFRYFKKRS